MRRIVLHSRWYLIASLIAALGLCVVVGTHPALQKKSARAYSSVYNKAFPPPAVKEVWDILSDPKTALVLETQPSLGDVVFFVDYNCPPCRMQFQELTKLVEAGIGVRLILRQFPHKDGSQDLALAALAAREQGRGADLHRVMMSQGSRQLSLGDLEELAAAAGLDFPRLQADMSKRETLALLEADIRLARVLRLSSTPTVIAADTVHRGLQRATAIAAWFGRESEITLSAVNSTACRNPEIGYTSDAADVNSSVRCASVLKSN